MSNYEYGSQSGEDPMEFWNISRPYGEEANFGFTGKEHPEVPVDPQQLANAIDQKDSGIDDETQRRDLSDIGIYM